VTHPIVCSLARATSADIDKAAAALQKAARPRIHVFLATSDLHLDRKLKITRDECLLRIEKGVTRARQHVDDVEFSCEDATRTDLDFLVRAVTVAVASGATTINLPDTVGYSTPDEIREFFRAIRTRVPHGDEVIFSAHCHDDLGLAVANSLAAVEGGARQIECTVNGIGERAGNAAVEEVVMAFHVRNDRFPYSTSLETRQLYPSSEMLSSLTGQGVQVNKAIVGRNAFAHEAGIHQDGVLKDRRTYEIMRAEDVGAPWNPLVLGKHSGRHAVQRRCADLGFALEGDELIEVYRALMSMADDRKTIGDDDIKEAVSSVRPVRAS